MGFYHCGYEHTSNSPRTLCTVYNRLVISRRKRYNTYSFSDDRFSDNNSTGKSTRFILFKNEVSVEEIT